MVTANSVQRQAKHINKSRPDKQIKQAQQKIDPICNMCISAISAKTSSY